MNSRSPEGKEPDPEILVSRNSSTSFIASKSDTDERNEDLGEDNLESNDIGSITEERMAETEGKAPTKSPIPSRDDQPSKIPEQYDQLYQRQSDETYYSSVIAEDINMFDSHWFDMPSALEEYGESDNLHYPSYQWISDNSVEELQDDPKNDDTEKQTSTPNICSVHFIPEEPKSAKLLHRSNHSITESELMSVTEEYEPSIDKNVRKFTNEETIDQQNHSGNGKEDKEVQTTLQNMVVVMVSPGRRRLGTESPHDTYMHYMYGKDPSVIYSESDLRHLDMRDSLPMVFHGEELLPNVDEECQGALDSVRDLSISSRSSTSTVGLVKPIDSGVCSTENEFDIEESQLDSDFVLAGSLCDSFNPRRQSSDTTLTQVNEARQLSDNEKPEKADSKGPVNKRKSRRRLRKFLCFTTT